MGCYSVVDFVAQLRAAAVGADGDAAVVERVVPLMLRLAQSRSWIRPEHYDCDPEQGFGVHVLHEESDHSLWLVAVSWLPHRGPAPHNHGTWAVVAGVDGEEENIPWKRHGRLVQPQAPELVGPGKAAAFLKDAIHSVSNPGERTTLSLHVYGKNLNHVERSQFDPKTGAEIPFRLQVQ